MKDKAQVSSYRWVVLFHLHDCRVHFAATLVEFRSNNNTRNDINFQSDRIRSRPSIDGLAINFIPVSIPAGLLIDKKGFKFGVSVGAIKPSAFSLLFPKQFDVVNFTYILEEVGVSYALRQRLNRNNWE